MGGGRAPRRGRAPRLRHPGRAQSRDLRRPPRPGPDRPRPRPPRAGRRVHGGRLRARVGPPRGRRGDDRAGGDERADAARRGPRGLPARAARRCRTSRARSSARRSARSTRCRTRSSASGRSAAGRTRLRSGAEIPGAVQGAFHLFRTGRPGPVALSIPTDLLTAPVDGAADARRRGASPAVRRRAGGGGGAVPRPAPARPLLVAGGGVIAAERDGRAPGPGAPAPGPGR